MELTHDEDSNEVRWNMPLGVFVLIAIAIGATIGVLISALI